MKGIGGSTIEAELNRDGMYASLATSQGRDNAINLQEFGNSNIDYQRS